MTANSMLALLKRLLKTTAKPAVKPAHNLAHAEYLRLYNIAYSEPSRFPRSALLVRYSIR